MVGWSGSTISSFKPIQTWRWIQNIYFTIWLIFNFLTTSLIFINLQVFIILALAAVASADNAPRYGYAPAPAYGHAAPAYADEAPVYAFNYGVADDYSGATFNHGENRDGYATSGSYSVALPDGRIQTVNYRVDDAYSGYVADVTYSGEPKYAPAPAYKATPAYAPAPYKPAPAYAPAPVYHSAPVYRG